MASFDILPQRIGEQQCSELLNIIGELYARHATVRLEIERGLAKAGIRYEITDD